ncbi:MAG: ABC transporter permease, partial [Clostridiales bacterium]|nr:ABC transporter permease [Clostridiales bacterium]
ATKEQIALARSQILASRKALNALDKPQWYILDRDANPGYAGFSEDSDKIEAIGRVFPAIFFIVAALVSLTTMTRLVEERRIEIGTLKSLGYGNLAIMSKYILYAAAPTVLGGLAGGYFGMQFFPVIIISAYSMLYAVPYPVTPLHIPFWMTGIVIGALSTLIATIAACENELRASPSTLMRPKSPKLGKRILLERIPLLWRSLSFIQKVTVRNIFRYKKRFFMTIVGVAGCTALLMTGFGLRDSVTAMLDLQFVEINRYDLTTTMTDTAKASDLNAVVSLLAGDDFVRGNMPCRRMTYDAGSEQPGMNARAPVSVTLVVPQDAETFHEYIVLRDRTTHAQLPFGASVAAPGGSGGMEGAVITEKLASLLGLVPGDSFFITDEDGVRIDILVSGITENYYAHYVYMTAALYTQLLGQAPEYNCVYTFLSETTLDDRIQLAGKVLNRKGVNAIYYTSAISETFQEVITNLNFVVLVLILSAAALAFVVLLNLTSINISERIRELATIEVLGFYDREVSAYVYRENIALTVIGAGIGLLLGVALHLYVVVSTETELMMFGRKIRPESFVYSVLLTLIFSICVNILTGKRLRSINMVEARKSVE